MPNPHDKPVIISGGSSAGLASGSDKLKLQSAAGWHSGQNSATVVPEGAATGTVEPDPTDDDAYGYFELGAHLRSLVCLGTHPKKLRLSIVFVPADDDLPTCTIQVSTDQSRQNLTISSHPNEYTFNASGKDLELKYKGANVKGKIQSIHHCGHVTLPTNGVARVHINLQ